MFSPKVVNVEIERSMPDIHASFGDFREEGGGGPCQYSLLHLCQTLMVSLVPFFSDIPTDSQTFDYLSTTGNMSGSMWE